MLQDVESHHCYEKVNIKRLIFSQVKSVKGALKQLQQSIQSITMLHSDEGELNDQYRLHTLHFHCLGELSAFSTHKHSCTIYPIDMCRAYRMYSRTSNFLPVQQFGWACEGIKETLLVGKNENAPIATYWFNFQNFFTLSGG